IHFNDPSFREDALRGISKTVTHINDLISRLSLLRQELAVKPVQSDLNELLTQALKDLNPNLFPTSSSSKTESSSTGGVDLHLQPLPKIAVDAAQIRNVVTNLLFNARDAVASNGQIRVETSQRNGWVVLA